MSEVESLLSVVTGSASVDRTKLLQHTAHSVLGAWATMPNPLALVGSFQLRCDVAFGATSADELGRCNLVRTSGVSALAGHNLADNLTHRARNSGGDTFIPVDASNAALGDAYRLVIWCLYQARSGWCPLNRAGNREQCHR